MKKALLVLTTVLTSALILSSLALIRTTTSGANVQLNAEDGDNSEIAGIYLRIEGIPGESVELHHGQWIEISSYDWNESNAASTSRTGASAGRVAAEDFHFVKAYDKSSPKLFLACCKGQRITRADLEITKMFDGEEVFLTYRFDNIIISYYGTSGEIGRSPGVLDDFSITFEKLTVTYKQLSANGTVVGPPITANWNYRTNLGS